MPNEKMGGALVTADELGADVCERSCPERGEQADEAGFDRSSSPEHHAEDRTGDYPDAEDVSQAELAGPGHERIIRDKPEREQAEK